MNTANTTIIRLTTENVNGILNRCLYTPGTPLTEEILNIEGYQTHFSFDSYALRQEKENIEALLSQLPASFKEGCSFWELYRTDDGKNWTTSLKTMEALMALGIGINKLRYLLPKESWWSLPGGAPYVAVNS